MNARPVTKNQLSTVHKEMLADCGPDAQDHPLESADSVLRFKADPVINYLIKARGGKPEHFVDSHAVH